MQKMKRVVFYCILVLCMYVVVECFSFIAYYLARREIFSFSQHQSMRLNLTDSDTISNDSPEIEDRKRGEAIYETLHPYLGYVHNPQKMGNHTEYGFPGSNIPGRSENNNTVNIGIFGGSFANGLSKQGENALISTLTASSEFLSKDIHIYTIALGGFKQPQQFFALAYLLSLGYHFDIIINVDGFNEIVLPVTDNIPKHVFPFYPRDWFGRVYNFQDPDMLMMLGEIAVVRKQQKHWAALFAETPLRYSITANCIWEYYHNRLVKQYVQQEIAFQRYNQLKRDDVGYLVTGPSFHYRNDAELYDALSELWKQCSIQMHNLAITNGITYFHILQPSQYVPGSKIITEEERKIAILENHPYRTGVEKGYPYLIQKGADLVRYGVDFYDFTKIFAENDEPLYQDTCCHLNKQGYEIVSKAIGEIIVKHVSMQNSTR